MNAGDFLRDNEELALSNNQIVSRVIGKKVLKPSKKKGSFGVVLLATGLLIIFLLIFSSSELIPGMIINRLTEATDVQYADAVASKIIVFAQALAEGEVPVNTAELLKENNVAVGYLEDGNFVEGNSNEGGLVLLYRDEIITAKNFSSKVSSDSGLYDAFTKATYGRTAYYYDDAANEVFRKIGTGRNNYSSSSDFNDIMERMVGEGSNIEVNNVSLVEKKKEEDGKEVIYYDYESDGESVKSNSSSAADFVEDVRTKNTATTKEQSLANSTSVLNIADTVSKEQKSSIYFLALMENIDKMRAGEGNESKINQVMNYLYDERESSVIDVNTGEVKTVYGSMMQSPSLSAILSGTSVAASEVENYASDRILKTVKNTSGVTVDSATTRNSVTSTSTGLRGSIGRLNDDGNEISDSNSLAAASYTINDSLFENSFSNLGGIAGGELLVDGAVNVGKQLAKASGSTAGSVESIKSYARLTSSILAMDAEVDRMNRSPFDITSKNTFLGSIIYNFAISMRPSGSFFTHTSSLMGATSGAIARLSGTASADDETNVYLNNFGDCPTINSAYGAAGTVGCSEIDTFDTSTLNDPFNDAGFINFVENNTTLNNNGVRTINSGSDLEKFIIYQKNRSTPLGITDGGIVESLKNSSGSISLISNILSMVTGAKDLSSEEQEIASGAAFVNSPENEKWQQTYKYAQRYVSLARAADSLRQYSGDETAYTNLKYFEGPENPVVAFEKAYFAVK